jgi:hypothetical protein
MNAPNGHGQESSALTSAPSAAMLSFGSLRFPAERVKDLVATLEVPFDPSRIEWRVTSTSQNKTRGQVIPYADQRAYTDRLNALFTPAGWTRKYTIHTSANFERSKDQKIVAKVLVTCELTIFGLGSHSATGEEWADNDNAGTSAEAQAFKRASSCFGLGRYLYYFTGTWVNLDAQKRPKNLPKLADWATPEGWRQGLRPYAQGKATSFQPTTGGNSGNGDGQACDYGAGGSRASALAEIAKMERSLGKRMYRGLLKTLAGVWNPADIRECAVQQKVLVHMQAAERGFRRLDVALDKVGPERLTEVLHSLKLRSLDRVDNLQTLHQIVLALEATAQPGIAKH